MSQRVNIGPTEVMSDSYYRYYREKVKVTAPNKQGQVTITNFATITRQLELEPGSERLASFIKYLKKEFGTNVKELKNDKKNKNVVTDLVINGHLTVDDIESKIQAFTEIYILCPSEQCRKPELAFYIEDNTVQCKACGISFLYNKDKKKSKKK